jgi:hypothetical protein
MGGAMEGEGGVSGPGNPFRVAVERIRGEFTEDPSLRVTCVQATHLFGLDVHTCHAALVTLAAQGFLRTIGTDTFVRAFFT